MGERKLNNEISFVPSGGIFQLMAEFCKIHDIYINEATQDITQGEHSIAWQDVYIDMQAISEKGVPESKVKAFLNSRYCPRKHPIQDYILLSQTHMDNPLNQVIDTLTANHSKTYLRTMLGKWMVGMVATVFEGLPNVLMPVLVGSKNLGKTYWFRNLLPDGLKTKYFAQSQLNKGTTSEMVLTSHMMVLNDELDGWTKYSAESFRNMISTDYFTYRVPYGSKNIKVKRLASICGTANRMDIIYDFEHNRRIIPIEVQKIDWEAFNAVNKEQLISQCYQLYLDNFNYELTTQEIEMLEMETKKNRVRSKEMDLIEHYFEPPEAVKESTGFDIDKLTTGQVIEYIQEHSKSRDLKHSLMGKALHSLGYAEYAVKGKNGNNIYQIVKRSELGDSSHLIDRG